MTTLLSGIQRVLKFVFYAAMEKYRAAVSKFSDHKVKDHQKKLLIFTESAI